MPIGYLFIHMTRKKSARHSRDQWWEHVRRQRQGESSVAEYCKEHNLCTSQFYRWRKICQANDPQPSFVPIGQITVQASQNPTIRLIINKRVIEISTGFDEPTLIELIRALESI